jgi:hypothetical protein
MFLFLTFVIKNIYNSSIFFQEIKQFCKFLEAKFNKKFFAATLRHFSLLILLRKSWKSLFWPNCNLFTLLGPRQTSNFYKQYCDKNIKQYCHKMIFFSSLCELKITICGYFSWFWKARAIFCQKNIAFVKKMITLLQYRFIAISLAKIARLDKGLK